ncbi:MAG: 50S ribosomal protein L35 [Armatimonadetes bacterium]|nr:50S ribosomal protein L35 [Armatimonadota bacterium]
MSRVKTHQGAAKRFKVTGSGRLMRRRQMTGHFRVKKSGSRMRSLQSQVSVHRANEAEIARLLPYRR